MHAHSLSVRLKFSDAVKALKALLLSITVALRLCNLERDWVGHLIIDSCLPEGSRLRILSWSEELKKWFLFIHRELVLMILLLLLFIGLCGNVSMLFNDVWSHLLVPFYCLFFSLTP